MNNSELNYAVYFSMRLLFVVGITGINSQEIIKCVHPRNKYQQVIDPNPEGFYDQGYVKYLRGIISKYE